MTEYVNNGTPVNRDATAVEHNPEDLKAIEEMRAHQGAMLVKLDEVAEERAMLMKQVEELKNRLRCMEDRTDRDSCSRVELMNALDRTRCELNTVKMENAMLKMKLRSMECDDACDDLEISEVMEDLIENAEQMAYGLRALYSILKSRLSEDCKSSCEDTGFRDE